MCMSAMLRLTLILCTLLQVSPTPNNRTQPFASTSNFCSRSFALLTSSPLEAKLNMPGKPGIPRPLRVIAYRLKKLAKRVKYRIKSRTHRTSPRRSYTRYSRVRGNPRIKAGKKRRARFQSFGARIRQRSLKLPVDPAKKNELFYQNVWIGNQDNAQLLGLENITRIFHLDRKIIILQPHVGDNPDHPPQLAFYEAYDYHEKNFLKDFETLCRIMRVEAFLGNNVLIYCAANPTREEYSRARTLAIAYGIYSNAYCMLCIRRKIEKPFHGVRKDHMEQLRVWDAMIKAPTEVNKIHIYRGWEEDKKAYLKWREHGVLNGSPCTEEEENECLVM